MSEVKTSYIVSEEQQSGMSVFFNHGRQLVEQGDAITALGLAMQDKESTITKLVALTHKAGLTIEFRVAEP